MRSTVTRRQSAEPVDQAERAAQLQHHQAAVQAANQAAAATRATEAIPKYGTDPHALQSTFLASCMGKPIVIHLANGVRLSGKLAEFDQYCLLIKSENQQQLIFKHAVSTVIAAPR